MTVQIGSVRLRNAVMTAAGTAGYGTELSVGGDLAALGAVVVKSLAAFAWDGNPAPRLRPTALGMLNAVGLQGPGVAAWRRDVLPSLLRTGATVVVSIWGRTVEEYAAAAAQVAACPEQVVAVEVNLSCPNLHAEGSGAGRVAAGASARADVRRSMFAHDPQRSAEVIAAVGAVAGRPCWAKLSPNTERIVEVAAAVADAGAEAVTCVNTLLGLAYDRRTERPALAVGGGGLSGPAIHPVAVRIVADVHAALPELPIVGVGGIATGWDAREFLLAGAAAVQVGTATFADPRAPWHILADLG